MDTKIYKIVSNKQLTPSIYEMKLEGDTSMISAPGQFLNIKLDAVSNKRHQNTFKIANTTTLVPSVTIAHIKLGIRAIIT